MELEQLYLSKPELFRFFLHPWTLEIQAASATLGENFTKLLS
jgi:hypothetical protein